MVLNDSTPAPLSWRLLLAVGMLSASALPVGVRGADAQGRAAADCDRATVSAEVDDATPSEIQHKGSPERPSQTLPPDGERLEMNLSTSWVLVADHEIPRAQADQPDIVELTPLSPTRFRRCRRWRGRRPTQPGRRSCRLWLL